MLPIFLLLGRCGLDTNDKAVLHTFVDGLDIDVLTRHIIGGLQRSHLDALIGGDEASTATLEVVTGGPLQTRDRLIGSLVDQENFDLLAFLHGDVVLRTPSAGQGIAGFHIHIPDDDLAGSRQLAISSSNDSIAIANSSNNTVFYRFLHRPQPHRNWSR